jgi:integrase
MPAYKDKDRGTWYIKYSYTDRITGKRKQVLKRGFPTKREASLWEAQQRSNEQQPTSLTFRALMGKYYDYRKPRDRTKENQTSMLETYFPLIDQPVDRITKQMMMEWYLELTSKDLSIGTKNLILTVVKSIFRFGAEFYDLPNHSSSLKRLRSGKRKYAVWTIEEFNQFIEFEPSPLYKAAFTFLYMVGCRCGELLGLQYTDFVDGRVHIHQQMTDRGLAPLKTESSERTLKLPDAVQTALEPILSTCSEEQPFVFPIPKTSLYDHFKRAIQASGVPDIRIHDLRHSFATNAICSGASIVAVSKYLGHASITITLNTYTHLLDKTDDEMIGIMNNLYKNA